MSTRLLSSAAINSGTPFTNAENCNVPTQLFWGEMRAIRPYILSSYRCKKPSSYAAAILWPPGSHVQTNPDLMYLSNFEICWLAASTTIGSWRSRTRKQAFPSGFVAVQLKRLSNSWGAFHFSVRTSNMRDNLSSEPNTACNEFVGEW